MEYTLENVRNEMNFVLKVRNYLKRSYTIIVFSQWWWTDRYNRSGPLDKNRAFGQWLFSQYRDANSASPPDNSSRPRFS